MRYEKKSFCRIFSTESLFPNFLIIKANQSSLWYKYIYPLERIYTTYLSSSVSYPLAPFTSASCLWFWWEGELTFHRIYLMWPWPLTSYTASVINQHFPCCFMPGTPAWKDLQNLFVLIFSSLLLFFFFLPVDTWGEKIKIKSFDCCPQDYVLKHFL